MPVHSVDAISPFGQHMRSAIGVRALPDRRPFTIADAYACGWTRSALQHATKSGQLIRLRQGVFTTSDDIDPSRVLRAAGLSYPGAVLCHLSMARMRSMPVIGVPEPRIEMTVPPRTGANLRGIHAYRASLRDHEIMSVDGVITTSYARTAIDIARHYRLHTSVPLLDHVLHHELATAEELRDVLGFCRDWPGAARARRAVLLCDSRAESPLESISRLRIPRLGLPAPEPQVEIFDERGRFVGRCDFLWDELGVIGEADGRDKYDARAVLIKEKDRETELADTRLEMARWYWSHAWSEHEELAQRLIRAFRRAQARDRAGLTRRWTAQSTPRTVVL